MKKIVLVLAVLLVSVSACKNPFLKKMLVEEEKGESSAVPKHTVTFSVEGTGGTLKAKANGVEETAKSPISIEQGKKVTFTAEPAAPYVVKEWKVDGTVVTGNTSNSYTHTVTAAVDVKVIFDAPFVEGGASLILSPNKLVISVKAVTSDGSAVAVEGCTETSLASGSTYTWLHATGTVVILKGKIIELSCGDDKNGIHNKLTALNVQGLSALQVLSCGGNRLTALNVQGLTALQVLACNYNQLTALNVQGLTALERLECYENQLTTLDVQGLNALQVLVCGRNQLTALNVQGLNNLQELHCHRNQLTALDVQGLSNLQRLSCGSNKLTALNVQGLTALRDLFCEQNQLTALNIQGLSTLERLWCWDNQLTALNVQGCTALQWLWCWENQLTAINVQGCTALRELRCYDNQLTTLNVQGCTALQSLDCTRNRLTALNAQGCTALQSLDCSGEQLTTLDVQGCTALQSLNCSRNQLTALNIQGLSALKWLSCYNNKLTAQAFTKLFDDLPVRQDSDKGECILYTEESGVTEGNHTDFTAPPDLAAAFDNAKNNKKWKMCKWNGSGSWVEI